MKNMNETNMPLITIIIPVYNVEQYIDKCIDSVCNQTYRNLEIIIVDDGSTDNSFYKCLKWQEKDGRIIVLHKENGGLSSARNAGLEIASGQYIGFVDSDDYILPYMYEKLLDVLCKNDADVARCDFFCTGEKNEEQDRAEEILMTTEEMFLYSVSHQKWAVWCNLYDSKVWKTIRFPNGRYYEDAISFPEVASVTKKWILTSQKLYGYNTVNTSITRCDMTEKHFCDVVEMLKVIGNYAASISIQSKEAAYYVWQSWMAFFNLALRSPKITRRAIKQGWKKLKREHISLYYDCKKSQQYKKMSFQAKIKWIGFRYFPIQSQMLINYLSHW